MLSVSAKHFCQGNTAATNTQNAQVIHPLIALQNLVGDPRHSTVDGGLIHDFRSQFHACSSQQKNLADGQDYTKIHKNGVPTAPRRRYDPFHFASTLPASLYQLKNCIVIIPHNPVFVKGFLQFICKKISFFTLYIKEAPKRFPCVAHPKISSIPRRLPF